VEAVVIRRNWRGCRAALLLVLLGVVGLAIGSLTVHRGTSVEPQDRHDMLRVERVRWEGMPEVRLTNQNGDEVGFLSDVLKKRTALISFIYTGCSTICPLVGATIAAVAEDLQKDNSNVAIVSISIDPDWDTPAQLLAWRNLYGDIPEWTLLTGRRPEIDKLLRSLGAYSANLEDHSDILLVGPHSDGQWTRMSSLASPAEVAGTVRAAISSQRY
jgi:protein SCO1